jgi:hypothetical protein
MSYSMNRRPLGQTPPPAPSSEGRREQSPLVTVALVLGTLIFAFHMYSNETTQPAYSED